MQNVRIQRTTKKDFPYIEEKLEKYILDGDNIDWRTFFVARLNRKTVAFGRIINHGEYFEIASLGVDYYHRKKGIGRMILLSLAEKAKRRDSRKPVYCVTHSPVFFKKSGFKETKDIPEKLKLKKCEKCKFDSAGSRVMIFSGK
ncbi:MAG: GNAT family N-acetyltransferase [Candidatus Omnitrophica bacterium]|nr:GNAT family N-acetyltransferase [Candidatus Omnitrophota bacterium]